MLAEGSLFRGELLSVAVLERGPGPVRFAFSAKASIGNAVVRNRVRRRLRESCRLLRPRLRGGWDVLVLAGQRSARATQRELAEELERLLARAGLLPAGKGEEGER